jgi:hypothetical protein
MTVIANNNISTAFVAGYMATMLFTNNFEYSDSVSVDSKPVSDIEFCMNAAESSLNNIWDNDVDDVWNNA